jgi:hypothetical protein
MINVGLACGRTVEPGENGVVVSLFTLAPDGDLVAAGATVEPIAAAVRLTVRDDAGTKQTVDTTLFENGYFVYKGRPGAGVRGFNTPPGTKPADGAQPAPDGGAKVAPDVELDVVQG